MLVEVCVDVVQQAERDVVGVFSVLGEEGVFTLHADAEGLRQYGLNPINP